MLQAMLCGASDTERVRNDFAEAIGALGGEAWHYQSGRILHINSAVSSWERNSRATVQAADLCVFVIMERFGEVTWVTELDEAMTEGKPFLVFCLQSTYQKYLTLVTSVSDLEFVADPSDRALVAQLRTMESDMQLTVIPFDHGYFARVLQRQLSTLFGQALNSLAEKNRRESIAGLFGDPASMTIRQLEVTAAIAVDETEDKTRRKRAIEVIAERGVVDVDTVGQLIRSAEQGVQRLAIAMLVRLCAELELESGFFEECVAVANSSDDVGVGRRLIPSLLDLSIPLGLAALSDLELSETGLRRRLTDEIEARELAIVRAGLKQPAIDLLRSCLSDPTVSEWKARGRALLDRLGG